MKFKRACGKIFGVELNSKEQEALSKEINSQIKENMAVFLDSDKEEIIARILWVLHTEFKFGETRLKRFYTMFDKSLSELTEYYQMGEEDTTWLCKNKLIEDGLDFTKWGGGDETADNGENGGDQ